MAGDPRAEGSSAGRKLLAIGVLVLSSYLLLRFVVRLATKFAWLGVALLAILGLVWAMVTLTRD